MEIKKKFNKLLVIDGSYMIQRALHTGELYNLKNSNGEGTGGIFGFLNIFQKEVSKTYYFPVVCFDNGLSERRLNLYPDYKLNKSKIEGYIERTDSEIEYVKQYKEQRNKLIEILEALGIPVLKFRGWEGDDLMYICKRLAYKSIILTDDKDMLQLLDENCEVRRPMKKENWDIHNFLRKNNFKNIKEFTMCKALLGDKSDNILKSCAGIGDKSQNEFLKYMESIKYANVPKDEKELREHCKNNNIKYKKAYLNFDKKLFDINMGLVDLDLVDGDITEQIIDSITSTIEDCHSTKNYIKTVKLFNKYEIRDISVDKISNLITTRYNHLYM